MKNLDTLPSDDLPLNLEQDGLLQTGRPSTCQDESAAPLLEVPGQYSPCACGDQAREIHQTDFKDWLA